MVDDFSPQSSPKKKSASGFDDDITPIMERLRHNLNTQPKKNADLDLDEDQKLFIPLRHIMSALGVFLLIIVLFVLFSGDKETKNLGDVPVIRADSGDYSNKPTEQGGMEIPNQDNVLLKDLAQNTPEQFPVEDLLKQDNPVPKKDTVIQEQKIATQPAPATPTTPPSTPEEQPSQDSLATPTPTDATVKSANAVPAETSEQTSVEPAKTMTETKIATTPPIEPAPVTVPTQTATAATAPTTAPTTAPVTASVTSPVTPPVVQPAAETPVAAATPPAAPATEAVKSGGSYELQLGSLSSESAAQTHWAGLQKQFPAQLSGATLKVEKADLGAKGVYYRVKATNFDEATAKDYCAKINAQKSGSCIAKRK
jgi:hypothetical protein